MLEVYVFGVLLTLAVALVISNGLSEDQKWAARLAMLCPVWPVVWLVAGGYGVKKLWKTADWRNFP